MTTQFQVSVWDSTTGETSTHTVECPSIPIDDLNTMVDVVHRGLCHLMMEDPEDWEIMADCPILSTNFIMRPYTGPDVLVAMYINKARNAVSVETILCLN